jgi:uncharacterized protein (TIGR01244 family)
MNIIEITPSYSVSRQIAVSDVEAIAKDGFNSIMCNRPDGEDIGQTDVAVIRAEADRLGLTFAFVPVVSGDIQPNDVSAFRAALAELPAPVLAYCRSGARCQNLWMLARQPI